MKTVFRTGFEKGARDLVKTLPLVKRPITEQNAPLWVNPDTLDSAPVGMTPEQAEAQGFVKVTAPVLSRVNEFKAVQVLLGRLKTMAGNVFPSDEGAIRRVWGGSERVLASIFQTDVDTVLLKKTLDGTQAALVRMFEKGTLTDQDIKRAGNLNIKLTDSGRIAFAQLDNLEEFIKGMQKKFIGKNRAPSLGLGKPQGPRTVGDSPFPEGTELKGPGGKLFIVRDGKPVLK